MGEELRVDATARFRVVLFAIVVLHAATVLPFLGRTSLWRTDEARAAEIARQMSRTGDWGVPRIGDTVYSRYPPLSFWLMAASERVLGVNEFAMRLPGALAGVLLLIVVARVARGLSGDAGGLSAALVLASTPGFLSEEATCRANTLLALFATLSVERFVAVMRGDRRVASIALFWVSLAGAVLARGPAGLVLPGLAVAAWKVLSHDVDLRRLWPSLGVPLLAALVLPWYVLVARREGLEFLEMNLLRENVEAFVSGFEHPRPFWYHLARLPFASFPWIFLAPFAWRVRREPGVAPAFGWAGLVLAFLSIASNKRASYLSWFHPAYAVALGAALPAIVRGVLPGGVRPRLVAAVPLVALAIGLAGAVYGAWLRPWLDVDGRAGTAFCRRIRAQVPPGERIGTLGSLVGDPAYYFYLGRPLETRAGEAGVYLAYSHELDRFAAEGRALRVLADHRDSHGRELLLLRVGDAGSAISPARARSPSPAWPRPRRSASRRTSAIRSRARSRRG